ncbi:hypothetical protein F5Y12DRAFT_101253 [Xylaria sp. FL1777]|nr:hypothetical protein F5Y12DRAFT_101253 [Xylaria sp. FL1777]
MPPRHCPFAWYTRLKVGIHYCESCLDETPPSHPPITEIIEGFDKLRALMDEIGISQGSRLRFSRECKAELREIRDNAAIAGVNNNFYNDIKALYELYHQRVANAIADAVARRQERLRTNEERMGNQ